MKKLLVGSAAYLLPVFVFAAVGTGASDAGKVTTGPLTTFFASINGIINIVVPFLIGIAVLMVIIGIFRMVINAGDEEARDAGKQWVIWGVIGIVLMLAVWGLVALLAGTFSGLTGAGREDVVPLDLNKF